MIYEDEDEGDGGSFTWGDTIYRDRWEALGGVLCYWVKAGAFSNSESLKYLTDLGDQLVPRVRAELDGNVELPVECDDDDLAEALADLMAWLRKKIAEEEEEDKAHAEDHAEAMARIREAYENEDADQQGRVNHE